MSAFAGASHHSHGSQQTASHLPSSNQPDGVPRLSSHSSSGKEVDTEEGEASTYGAASRYGRRDTTLSPVYSLDGAGVALLESLRQPREAPSWWGPRCRSYQSHFAKLLESSAAHYLVIGLTLLDLTVVVTELVLSSVYATHKSMPHAVHVAEDALSYTSITILCLFTAEVLARLAVFGYSYFTRSKWHMFDALVVVTSLVLELSLHDMAREVASLLIFFRLWRIMRIVHSVAEAMELNHEAEMERQRRLLHALRKDLAREHCRVRQLEHETAALSAAAAGAGVDVPSILRLAAAAVSEPEVMVGVAQAVEAEQAAEPAGSRGSLHHSYV